MCGYTGIDKIFKQPGRFRYTGNSLYSRDSRYFGVEWYMDEAYWKRDRDYFELCIQQSVCFPNEGVIHRSEKR